MRQVHGEEVDLPLHPADLRQRLAKVDLRMSRIMAQRHEHLALPQPTLVHIVLHDRQPAGVAVLVPKPLEDPLRGVPLLRRTRLSSSRIRSMIPMNGSSFGRAGGLLRRYPGGTENTIILAHRPRVDPEPSRRLAMAQPLNLHRIADPSIELHALHPPPSANSAKSYPLPDFYSGATGLSGRFSEGFCSGAYSCGRDRFVRRLGRSDLWRRNETSAGRYYPAVAPPHNRHNAPHPR